MIKNQYSKKTIALFFIFTFLNSLFPYNAIYANNNGPNAPEASGFEPVSATDMVNLSSGDMAYVLPLLEIDGFPVTLSYHAGIPMDMEASWVGLGWNINTGAISRGVVSTPDDWNKGRSMKFTYYYYETESYTVNVGVGFGKAAEVGVGLSWGSNKSLSGSVSASIGPISASIDTNGNYGVGINSSIITKGLGFKDAFAKPGSGESSSPFGGSLSISGNTSGGGISGGANVGYSKDGLNAGMGISISGNGIGAGYSIGGGQDKEGSTKWSAGGGGSIGSFSVADMNISSSGFYLPINIWIFSFGFGYQRQKISYKKGLNRYGFGSLYQAEMINSSDYRGNSPDVFNTNLGERNDPTIDNTFEDFQRRNYYGDTYDQELPQSEVEFVGSYKKPIEKINFTFAGYDTYGVNATGISGGLSPIVGENTVLIGEGYEGDDSKPNSSKQKMKIFYHNSIDKQASGKKSKLSTNKNLQSNNFHFAFKGQIMNDMSVSGSLGNFSRNKWGLNLADFSRKGRSNLNRPKTGSYVEVFTNAQLDTDTSKMLLPTSLFRTKTTPLSRESLGYTPDGIGGYKITTPDGKTYHFAQPVYQYEKIEHNYIEIDKGLNMSGLNSTSKRSATPYATHWLLTAITGPDYIDDGNNYPDENDLGYWLRLDHGRWSNAYTWRTPYAGTNLPDLQSANNSILVPKKYRRYNTYNKDDIDKVDAGQFMQGRKDLYYLDKIVSRQQIAYFVKDVRKDGIGTDLDYTFTNTQNTSLLSSLVFPSWKQYDNINVTGANPTFNNEVIKSEEDVKYEHEYLLRLDKIVITKNLGKSHQVKENIGGNFTNLSSQSLTDRYHDNGIFKQNLPQASQTHKLHQANNVIDVNDFANFDYSKALKIIKFNSNYELAKESPNSLASTKGRLTLKGVKFYGRGMKNGARETDLYDYMPPYRFSYKRPNLKFSTNNAPAKVDDKKDMSKKDSWGFIEGNENDLPDSNPNRKTLADSWSLNKIQTPQGSTIDIEYEEDDYYVEAFSRRYWEDNLQIKFEKTIDNGIDNFIISITNQPGMANADFKEYFNKGDLVYFDIWLNKALDVPGWDSGLRRGKIDITTSDICKVVDITNENILKLSVKGNHINNKVLCGYNQEFSRPGLVLGTYFAKSNNIGSPVYVKKNRGECILKHQVPNKFAHTMNYKLLATKSPKGNSGGGLKVTKITVNGESGDKYETTYDYRVPNLENGGFYNKSSGITSFYPVYGTSFVPYQNELPGPGVMYEWVTMKAKAYSASGQALPSESTRYHYYTLQPNFHIFDPGFTMEDNDGDVLFKATVKDITINKADIKAKDIKIEKNLSKVGQLISIEQLNDKGHLMNKTVNSYAKRNHSYKETFSSLKSVYAYNYNKDKGTYSNRETRKRLLSLSTKIETEQILNKVTTVTPYGKSNIEYFDADPWLGNFRTSVKTMSDGTKVKETKYPAYERYYKMGSKVTNPNNKNMLTQEAMTVTSVKPPNTSGYKTTNANITTWKNDWLYRDEMGKEKRPTKEAEKIWRKHKTYVWKGSVNDNGTYTINKELKPTDFKWGAFDSQSRSEWQNVSEITRYTRFSLPIETRDINNNYASSKMDENWSKTIAGGNAKYTEMYYSGVEYPNDVNNFKRSEDEFTFENCKISNDAHTGKHGVSLLSSSKAFKLNKKVNTTNAPLKPGAYKVSFWAHNKYNVGGVSTIRLIKNGKTIAPSEVIPSGDWTLLNYIINVRSGQLNLHVENTGAAMLDDFRLHPISSSMNSYVYDQKTDELRYILDANNLATEFKYDKAGRLCKTYKEVINNGKNIGGFKLVKQYRYRYKNTPSNSGFCGCCEADKVTLVNDAPIAKDDTYSFLIKSTRELELNILDNDYDLNSFDVLSIKRIVNKPKNGKIKIKNGKIVYTPNSGFYGTDTFTYSIKDNGKPIKTSNTATVTINIDENRLIGYIKASNLVSQENEVCGDFSVKIAEGSGSGQYSYSWKLKKIDAPIETIYTGSHSTFDACIPCSRGRGPAYTIECTVIDLVSKKGLRMTRGTGRECTEEDSGSPGGETEE